MAGSLSACIYLRRLRRIKGLSEKINRFTFWKSIVAQGGRSSFALAGRNGTGTIPIVGGNRDCADSAGTGTGTLKVDTAIGSGFRLVLSMTEMKDSDSWKGETRRIDADMVKKDKLLPQTVTIRLDGEVCFLT
jgi:hypothetical protein